MHIRHCILIESLAWGWASTAVIRSSANDFLAYQTQSSRLRLQINLNGLLVTIYNVHLTNPLDTQPGFGTQAHSEAIRQLLDMLSNEGNPLIVAGDFNMTDLSPAYEQVRAKLSDSFRESGTGLGYTFPSWSPFPLARLDYIFHSSDMRSLSAEVIPSSGGSDHFPVTAALMIEQVAVTPEQ